MAISDLVDSIKKDLEQNGTYDRYPVRFMSMKYDEGTLNAIMQLQQQLGDVSIYSIQEILPHDDAWLNSDRFMSAIKKLNPEKSFIIVGFSEYARFLSEKEFVTMMIALLEFDVTTENIKRRIYIPCFALYSMIKKTVKQFHRRKDAYNPLLNETDVEDLPQIYFIDSHLDVGMQANEVENSSEWFSMWRNTDIDTRVPIICSSPTLAHFYKCASPDNVYNIKSIGSYQEMLQFLYGIKIPRPYKKNQEKYFKELISVIKSKNNCNIDSLICERLNTQSIDASNIYTLWKVNNTFDKWLIQNYILKNASKDSYLYKVMDAIDDLTELELLEKVYELIFELNDTSFHLERNTILYVAWRTEKDLKFTNRMCAYYSALIMKIVRRKTTLNVMKVDFEKDNEVILNNREALYETMQTEVVPYLTHYSEYERWLIIWLYRMDIIEKDQLKNLYPDLFMYVNGIEADSEPGSYKEKINKYFELYRKAKCGKASKDDYDRELLAWNENEERFYAWYMDPQIDYPEILIKKKGFNGNTYVIDAISAEYLYYIVFLLEVRGYVVETAEYAKCHLPSITEVAQAFYPQDWQSRWLKEFDHDVVHNGYYYDTPKMEKALTCIAQMIDLIIKELPV